MRPVILLFAKVPVAGHVKTRLIPRLGAEEARSWYERLVRTGLAHLAKVAPVVLMTDRPTEAWPEFRGPRELQGPGDLGMRMLAALERHLVTSHPVMIVGGDVPPPPRASLQDLLASPADVTLGPAVDGGFYAISCRRTTPSMFKGVVWSSGQERVQTERACRRAGLSVVLGPPWFDVDTPEDLERARRLGIL